MAGYQRVDGIIPNQYLFSTKGSQFTSKTLSASVVDADADGNKYVNKGTLLAKITVGAEANKVGPYDSGATDGRQTVGNIQGYCNELANLRHGNSDLDKDVPVLYAGTVDESKVIVDGVKGTVASAVKDACRTEELQILHKS